MALYRKKPVIREANQWHGPSRNRPPGVESEYDPVTNAMQYYVTTAQGQKVYIKEGEYVVKEPTGTGYYPCDAKIFEAEYDPA